MRLRASLLALTLPFVFAALSGAQAAPQILALVASAEPVPLICRNGECGAEFSAFCLQEERASPIEGTRYTLHGGEGVRLIASTRDGGTIELPVGTELKITTSRSHTTVRISIDVSTLFKNGYKQVAALVGENISLVPAAYPNDPNPQTEQDIALATGPLRKLGTRLVDQAGLRITAASLTNRLRSALPLRGRTSHEERQRIWEATFGPGAGDLASSGPGRKARKAYEECRQMTEGGMSSLSECLGAAHDKFIGRLNNEYWDATKFGF